MTAPGGPQRRTSLKVPHLTLGGRVDNSGNIVTDHQPVGSHRSTQFTDDDVIKAWHGYAQTHPTEHVLINAMRTSNPVRRNDSTTFDVVMVNQIQVDTINACITDLLVHMRDTLQNDSFNIVVSVSDGPPSPDTWNEHEVLKYMLENKPNLSIHFNTLAKTLTKKTP